jgi:tetratricopeptide (TPR) repeat protein
MEEITDSVLRQLLEQRDKIKQQMSKAEEAKDFDKYNELKVVWDDLTAKITARDELVKNSKKDAKRLLDEASMPRRDKKYAQAQEKYEAVLKLSEFIGEDKVPDIKLMIAFCQESLDKFPEALKTYSAVIEAQPQNADAHSGKGRVLSQMGQTAESINSFQKAIELDPQNYKNYFFIAQSYDKLGMFTESEANYLLATQKDPTYYKAGII